MPIALTNLLPLAVLVLLWLLIIRPLSHRWGSHPKRKHAAKTLDTSHRTLTKNQATWKVGLLYWGGAMFVVFAIVGPLIPHFTMGKPLNFNEYERNFITSACICFPAGALFGRLVWRHVERSRQANGFTSNR